MSDIKSKTHLQSGVNSQAKTATSSVKKITTNGGATDLRRIQEKGEPNKRGDKEKNPRVAKEMQQDSVRSDSGKQQTTSMCVPKFMVEETCQPKTDTNEADMETKIPRIRNYQIKSVKKGITAIDTEDSNVQRIRIAQAGMFSIASQSANN